MKNKTLKAVARAFLLLLVIGSLTTSTANANTIYDAATAFSASNPSGAWTFGRYTPLNVATDFVAASIYSADVLGTTLDFWSQGDGSGGFVNPSVFHNDTASAVSLSTLTVDAGGLAFHPGADGLRAVIRFTAPSDGYYSVTAAFRGGDSTAGQTDVHVFGGAFDFSGAVTTTYAQAISTTFFGGPAFFTQGQTIDFSVGYGANNTYFNDTTLVSAQVTSVPDGGTTVSFLGLALIGLGALGWKVSAREL